MTCFHDNMTMVVGGWGVDFWIQLRNQMNFYNLYNRLSVLQPLVWFLTDC